MESLSHPATVLSLGNTAAIIGISVWFSKKITANEEQIEELEDSLQESIKTFAGIKQHQQNHDQFIQQITEAIKNLNKMVHNHHMEIQTLKEEIRIRDLYLAKIISELNKQGLKLPLFKMRKHSKYKTDTDDEFISKPKKKKKSPKIIQKEESSSEEDTSDFSDSDDDIETHLQEKRSKNKS
jgi:archaellum component FlaC